MGSVNKNQRHTKLMSRETVIKISAMHDEMNHASPSNHLDRAKKRFLPEANTGDIITALGSETRCKGECLQVGKG
jgi:hypothetical protein